MPSDEIVLYGTELSGHAHRVALLLRALDLPYRFEVADATRRKSAEFRTLNPLGQIPVLRDGDVLLADSNAIMVYLVKRYAPTSDWLPDDPIPAAAVQRWLSIAAGEVRYGPALARGALQWNMPGDSVLAAEIAGRLLGFMEQHLSDRDWLAASHIPWPISPAIHTSPMRRRAVSRSIPIRVGAAGSQGSRPSLGSSQCRHRRFPATREVVLFGFRP
jgi:glutathione S-transferase